MKKIRIDIGCGRDKKEGCNTFIDMAEMGHNIVCDVEHDKLPFKDNTVEYIWCNHMLEHLRDVQHFLNECHRVLKKDGIMEVKVPYGLWEGAQKPVHYQCITACWFDWLRRKGIEQWYGYKSWYLHELKEIADHRDITYEVYCKMSPNKDIKV